MSFFKRMIGSSDSAAARCVDGLSNAVVLAWGRRRAVIALAAGGLSALSQPQLHLFFILFITLPVLVWLIDGIAPSKPGIIRSLWPAFVTGWLFGFGYFLAGLWWVGAAFLVEAETFAWLMPFAVLLLPAGLALFWGLGVAIARVAWSAGWQRVFALAAGLGISEWLRGFALTGFPWNSIGYSLTGGEVLIQSAWLLGLNGLNVLAVILFASPAVLAGKTGKWGESSWLPATAILALCGLVVFGFVRLANLSAEPFVPDAEIRIVQPAIKQSEKWRPENRKAIFDDLVEMTGAAPFPSEKKTLVVWPESTLPFILTNQVWALPAIADVLPDGATLLVGAARTERLPGDRVHYFNSAYLISDKGEILTTYDKVHLTPFGEYLPFQETLEAIGLEQLTQIQGGFEPGYQRATLSIPGLPPFMPLICYEAIFPVSMAEQGEEAGFIVNLTNDAWFGETPGPFQHFHQARVRSVERGLPLVRAANSGISAVTDSYGRIVESTALSEKAVLISPLPIASKNTRSAQRHKIFFIFLLLISITLSKTTVSFRAT